jgi:glycoprotein endo-alpha-1,2-mannosidase
MKIFVTTFLIFAFLVISCRSTEKKTVDNVTSNNVHIFYYNWYGSKKIDGSYRHWSHDIIPHWSDSTWNNLKGFPGGDNIGAIFFKQTTPAIFS